MDDGRTSILNCQVGYIEGLPWKLASKAYDNRWDTMRLLRRCASIGASRLRGLR